MRAGQRLALLYHQPLHARPRAHACIPNCTSRAQDVPHYIHAEHMYEAWNIKHKHLKWGVAITLFVSIPFGIPFFAVYWQQKKMAG